MRCGRSRFVVRVGASSILCVVATDDLLLLLLQYFVLVPDKFTLVRIREEVSFLRRFADKLGLCSCTKVARGSARTLRDC